MSLRNISVLLLVMLLTGGVCSLRAQTTPLPTQTSASAQSSSTQVTAEPVAVEETAAEQPDADASSSTDKTLDKARTQGLEPIEPSKDAKFSTLEFHSDKIPWQVLPLSDSAPTQ